MPAPGPGFWPWFRQRLPLFWHNWVCALGSLLTITATALLLLYLLLFLFNLVVDRAGNPYLDLVAFMVLPGFLVMGGGLLLAGNVIHRNRVRRGVPVNAATVEGGDALIKKALLVAGLAFVVMLGVGGFSYEAYHYTDSNTFCATVCHEVMAPEAAAYERSPHSRVKCVACHIGPGAEWYVQAKISGIRQVIAVMTDDYSKPIASPVENLRPARETCEVCHQPDKFHGSRIMMSKHYLPDADNTETVTAKVMHIGGPGTRGGSARGIHWHVDPRNQVRYRHTDRQRQDIVEVVLKTADGEVRFLKDGAQENSDQESGEGEWRVMDCLDCHNRPTHQFELPGPALDEAFAAGLLDRGVPWLRKVALQVLQDVTPGVRTRQDLAAAMGEIYRSEHPQAWPAAQEVLDPTARELAAILERNVFPQMNIQWGTYPSNLSHFDGEDELGTGGCFRCHDEEHTTADGRTIAQDCDLCHEILAYQEEGWAGLEALDMEAFLGR